MEGQDTKRRSIVKAVVWRIFATIITLSVAYAFTGVFSESLELTLVAAVISMAAYYVHERVWNRVSWGRAK